ncbi:MAG TPA: heme-binding domain-containing protein [Pseudosphingobacterium sp.]|jgi:Haem-binding domain|uniref:Heme-binding domain-containing protein n=3 Tax=Chryseobacterium TaxID=59732 RepID=A0AAJ1R0G9_9FLAO|nr:MULTISPECIES: heme-binding domain-containing protein [Flavobacteriales]MDN4011325.1 heme-binding domain-containing protein [Chryseobacterium gambrini]NML59262.1 heme-binding domain-containing protein [Chryseobacterium cheonjiense]QWA38095.1 heme-binding domain-containing protein [Chryseobacterium sp. ZHDP1]HWV70896.1 heme-binding domain-containing protein [Pseudosphingobacterium sp.]
MSLTKKIILGLTIILIGIQFFQPLQNKSDEVTASHIEKVYAVPQNVKAVLVQSCYDCHSNNTHYPWYSRIQPGSWYMAQHIKKGKEELNFSNFGEYSPRKQRNKFRAMAGQVKDGEMPLSSYTLIHRNAVLSQEDKQVLVKWFGVMEDSIK